MTTHPDPIRFSLIAPDPSATGVQFPVHDPIIRNGWTPALGPSAMCLALFAADHHGQEWTEDDLAAAFGLAPSKLRSTLDRLTRLALWASWRPDVRRVDVWAMVPPPPKHRLCRLPERLQREIVAAMAAQVPAAS